jgi:LCP family protein required for cell wall assembly
MLKKTACIFFAVIIAVAAFAGCSGNQKEANESETLSSNTQEASPENTVEEATEKATKEASPTPYPGELTNILLMGSMVGDFSNENNQNYALTHIVITIDPVTRSIRFTTFPYNLKVKPVLEDGAEETQLQFMYAQYGPDVVVDTFKARFGVEIDGWVVMNMDGVKTIVEEVGGLKVNIKELSINNMSKTVEDILGYVWHEIKEEGEQILNGIQISGYFMDTYQDLDANNPLEDEEMRFRERHEDIIDALIIAIKAVNMNEGQAVELAQKIEGNFLTDINEKDWEKIAKMALACIDNEHEYLHVPEVIEIEEEGFYRSIVYDRDVDVDAVKEFVYGE